ncbi:unnamed protein product [Malus baccata var. baccata]
MQFPTFTMSLFSFFLFPLFAFIAQAQVPANQTFTYVNEGEFGPFITEYDASYRMLDPFAVPFQLAFYNTTPNAFTLALRMGLRRSESLFRWVWEANRGNPVGENATLTFGTNGNLVLAHANGKVAWQTNTANKGVVGFKLLPNGNMVLHNSKGKFIWQSFDYPTNTLLMGQSLRVGAVSKLVSRAVEKENKDGPYSLVMEPKGLALYYKSNTLQNRNSTSHFLNGLLFRTHWLGIDGNVKFYTYNDKVDIGAWEVTFALFDRDNSIRETECQLPERCRTFSLCEDSQCVTCPSFKGLLGWSKSCAPEKLTSCDAKSFHYYKVEGVDHFSSKYTSGAAMKENDCAKKCWIAYDLKTLTKVANSTHVGYIKAPNH